MKKVEEYCLNVKDPLPFSLPGVGANPPSYDDAMNNVSFQAKVNGALARELDSVLARELQDKLNSEK